MASVIDLLVDRRRLFLSLLVAATVLLGFSVPGIKGDPTLKSAMDTRSPTYREYQRFTNLFGDEEFTLITLSGRETADNPDVLNRLATITQKLSRLDHVAEVLSLTTVKSFMEKGGKFGVFPLVTQTPKGPMLIGKGRFDKLREAVPALEFLLARDRKGVGILVRVDKRFRFDTPVLKEILDSAHKIVAKNAPKNWRYRVIGPHVLRVSVQHYNRQTAVIFGILSLLVSALVSAYIFKSLRVALITFTVAGLSVVWILGLMSLLRIPLSSTTGLSFGLVLVVSTATVIRIVTHFNERYAYVQDKTEACRQAFRVVFSPCLMCSVTTAVGFGTAMVSSIPMVFQLGMIMSLGVMLSFGFAVVLTPVFLIFLSAPDPASYGRMSRDWVATALGGMERIIFRHARVVAIFGLVFTAFMFAGVPHIISDTQILRMLSGSTHEMQDLRFVERHFAPIHTIELLIEAKPGTFNHYGPWEKVAELGRKLNDISEVVETDSLLPLLQYMSGMLHGDTAQGRSFLARPGAITELLGLMSFTVEGKEIIGRYLDESHGTIRVSVRIKDSESVPISATINSVRAQARAVMGSVGKVIVTGEIAVFADLAGQLVRSQLFSLVLAFILITILMMIELRSPVLGLISLIPNIPPVAVVFGVMGWMHVSLDTVTVFAATVALGLAVDDTIHYLAQLKQELGSSETAKPMDAYVRNAFDVTARAMFSTSSVLFVGFALLLISPFRPVVSFGILGSAAILAANVSDLMFLPSVILVSSIVRRLITRQTAAR